VLNDIGRQVPQAAAARIAAYVGEDLRFDDLAALEAHLRRVHATFGPLDDAAWHHLAQISARRRPDGSLALHYDPAIAAPFAKAGTGPIELGMVWDRVAVPTLVLRGAESDVLEAEVAAQMAARPGVALREFPGVGHAPALQSAEQVAAVTDFLGA
jgi:pimeloyl-ACP methyl ester carboxylesterase